MNAVVPDTSPAFSFEKELLSGKEYAQYLRLVAKTYGITVQENCQVTKINKSNDSYQIDSSLGLYQAKYLIVATGEFQNPDTTGIQGAELAMHYGHVEHFYVTSDKPFIIIGGNESACDALTHLAYLGNEVHLFTDCFGAKEDNPDPSISLSPITKERLKYIQSDPKYHIHIKEGKKARKIELIKQIYHVTFEDGSCTNSHHKPILATGFRNCCHLIDGIDLFDYDAQQLPKVNEKDESTVQDNCFLIGPSLRQGQTIFCYIYKFHQRFLPVIAEMAKRENWTLNPEEVALSRQIKCIWRTYLVARSTVIVRSEWPIYGTIRESFLKELL